MVKRTVHNNSVTLKPVCPTLLLTFSTFLGKWGTVITDRRSGKSSYNSLNVESHKQYRKFRNCHWRPTMSILAQSIPLKGCLLVILWHQDLFGTCYSTWSLYAVLNHWLIEVDSANLLQITITLTLTKWHNPKCYDINVSLFFSDGFTLRSSEVVFVPG